MKNEEMGGVVFLILIAGRKQKDSLLSALSQAGARLTTITYGKGTVKASYLQNILGLVPEENKVLITCAMKYEKSLFALKMLREDFNFDKPNTGIAFTIPVDNVSF